MILALLTLTLCASATVTTMKDADAKLAAAAAQANKIEQFPLGHFPGYSMTVTRRQGTGTAELHKTQNDIFVVESGTATLVTGGTIVGAKTTAPGEVRGSSITGGERRKLGQGDFVHIPANVPHQFLLDEGGQITYAVVKTSAR